MRTQEQIEEALNRPIPREAVRTRDNGVFQLSYLEGWYVIDLLNKIFGAGKWMYRIGELTKVFEGEVKGKFAVSYTSRVMLQLTFPDGQTVVFEDVGYGDGTDKMSPGKAHELATKEAVTDAIKRCAKNLGMSTGLALYDKEQRNVSDADEPSEKAEEKSSAGKKGSIVRTDASPDQTGVEFETVIATINQTAKVLDKRGIRTLDAIRGELQQKYGVQTARDLNENQAKAFLAVLEEGLK